MQAADFVFLLAKFKTSAWHRAGSQKLWLNEWKSDCCIILLSLPSANFYFLNVRILLTSYNYFHFLAYKEQHIGFNSGTKGPWERMLNSKLEGIWSF